MSEEITPNEEIKTNKLKFGKDQYHSLAQSFVEVVYRTNGFGGKETAPTPDTDHSGRNAKLDTLAHDQFVAFCQKWNPLFKSDSHCESGQQAKASGREQRIYADLFGLGDSYRVRGAVDKIADMDADILIAQTWERAKVSNPNVKKSEINAALEIAGLV